MPSHTSVLQLEEYTMGVPDRSPAERSRRFFLFLRAPRISPTRSGHQWETTSDERRRGTEHHDPAGPQHTVNKFLTFPLSDVQDRQYPSLRGENRDRHSFVLTFSRFGLIVG